MGGYAAQTFSIGAFGVWGPAFLHRSHGMSLDRAASTFGVILAAMGLAAMATGGLLGNLLRRRNAQGYVWLMIASMALAVPVCFFALTVGGTTAALTGLAVVDLPCFSCPPAPSPPRCSRSCPPICARAPWRSAPSSSTSSAISARPALVGAISEKVHRAMLAAGSAAALADTGNAIGLRYGVLLLPVVLIVGALLWAAMLAVPHREYA